MGLAYYGFAFFVFVLLCVFAILCKFLFTRNKVQRQNFDEKEKKLLTLYSTMEDMMDEFNYTALAANEEINRQILELRNTRPAARQTPPQATERPAPTPPPTPPQAPLHPAMSAENTQPVLVAEPATQDFTPLSLPGVTIKESSPASRPSRIVALHKQGMERIRIAKELSVTLSEVDLVLGLAAQKS
jgi:hypothetical protein